MSFILNTDPNAERLFKAVVSFDEPTSTGATATRRIKVEFLEKKDTEISDFLADVGAEDLDPGEAEIITHEFLHDVVRNVEDMKDENGEKIEYNEDIGQMLFSRSYIRNAMINAYMNACMGNKQKKEARKKN